jgi:hypothetical protein
MVEEKEEYKGIKYDGEKDQWHLLPMEPIESVIQLLMFGSDKYKADNWKFVKPKERYYDALLRHLSLWKKGEIVDPDSKLLHLTAVICNAIFLWWHDEDEKASNETGIQLRKDD